MRKKDYSGKALKWKNRKAKFKKMLKFIIPISILLIIVFYFLIDFTRINNNTYRSSVVKGDIVVVNKLSYGPYSLNNIPFTDIPMYSLRVFDFTKPLEGDVLEIQQIITDTATVTQKVINHLKKCIGKPGDTFKLTDSTLVVNKKKYNRQSFLYPAVNSDSADLNIIDFSRSFYNENITDVVVPSKGTEINLNAETIKFLKLLIEADDSDIIVTAENEKVFLNGTKTDSYKFKNDFYIVFGPPSDKGSNEIFWSMIPFNNIIGKAEFIAFSVDSLSGMNKITEVFDRIRWSRIFNSVD